MFFAAAFLIFCVVCSILAFVRHPIYGLYFYLAVTYVFPPARYWGSIFGGTRWSLIAAGVTVLAIFFHRGKLQAKPVWLANVPATVFMLYALWMLIQNAFAVDGERHFDASIQFVKYLVAFWFVYRIVDTKERVRDVLLAHLVGCGLLGIYAYYTGRTLGDRLDGVGGPGIDDANTLGMYFATAAIVGLGLLLTEKGWRRWLTLGCIVLVMEGLVLVNTRGAFVGLVAGGMVLALVKAKLHRRLFWALTVVGLLGVVSILDQKFIDRMWTIENITSDDADGSTLSRFAIVEGQWRMFLDYPAGAGHRGTETLSPLYLDKRWLSREAHGEGARSSHNTFMTSLVEQGILGALLFSWVALWTAYSMLRVRRIEIDYGDPNLATLAASIFGALAVVFVAGNSVDLLMAEVQFWLFATLVSIFHFTDTKNSTDQYQGVSGAIKLQEKSERPRTA